MDIAVVTGASSGLGKKFAEKVVERYKNLDEIWLIARGEERMREFETKYPNRKFKILPIDLSLTSSFDILKEELNKVNPNIKVVINNAGVDKAGLFRNMDEASIYSIINVNIMGMTMISRLTLPYMKKGSYQIIVGSEGSYLPLPIRAVYGSSKTYGRFFSRALREEEKRNGVNILFMGTGAMKTEMFMKNATEKEIKSTKFLDLDVITVKAMDKAEKGKAIYSPGWHTKMTRIAGKIFPSAISVKFAGASKFVPKE